MSLLFNFLGFLLFIALFIVALLYLTPHLPPGLNSLLNNTIKTLNNSLKILDIGAGAAVSATTDVAGAVDFVASGRDPTKYL